MDLLHPSQQVLREPPVASRGASMSLFGGSIHLAGTEGRWKYLPSISKPNTESNSMQYFDRSSELLGVVTVSHTYQRDWQNQNCKIKYQITFIPTTPQKRIDQKSDCDDCCNYNIAQSTPLSYKYLCQVVVKSCPGICMEHRLGRSSKSLASCGCGINQPVNEGLTKSSNRPNIDNCISFHFTKYHVQGYIYNCNISRRIW